MGLNNYEINLSFDPKNRYDKAKKDLIQAMKSLQALTSEERYELAKEFFGVNYIEYAQMLFQNRI